MYMYNECNMQDMDQTIIYSLWLGKGGVGGGGGEGSLQP